MIDIITPHILQFEYMVAWKFVISNTSSVLHNSTNIDQCKDLPIVVLVWDVTVKMRFLEQLAFFATKMDLILSHSYLMGRNT